MEIAQFLLSTSYFIQNEYFDKYVDLINSNLYTEKQKFKTNSHHIIPVSYFKHRNLEVDNSNNNKINLLFKDHVLAHYYLYFCSSTGIDKYSNLCAIKHLCGLCKSKNIQFNIDDLNLDNLQQMYEEGKQYFSDMMKGRLCGDKNPAKRPEVGRKISDARKGHPVNLETRRAIEAMRKANTGSDKSRFTEQGYRNLVEKMKKKYAMQNPETVEKMRKSVTGLRRVTNGVENKTIKPELLQEYIDKGFWVGVTFKTKPGKKT